MHLPSTKRVKIYAPGNKTECLCAHAGLSFRAFIIFLDYLASGNLNLAQLTQLRDYKQSQHHSYNSFFYCFLIIWHADKPVSFVAAS